MNLLTAYAYGALAGFFFVLAMVSGVYVAAIVMVLATRLRRRK